MMSLSGVKFRNLRFLMIADTVVSGQIDTDHADIILALQALEIGLQRGLTAPQDEIVDFMSAQIAEGRGKALFTGKEVFVDAQDLRAAGAMPLGELALESLLRVALDGGGPDLFPPSQAAAVDAVEMLLEDRLLEGLTGTLVGENAGELLAEVAAAVQAMEFAALQQDDGMAESPVLVADLAYVPAFAAEVVALAMRTAEGPLVTGGNAYPSHGVLDVGNLVSGQA
jgi:hypothetical protein